ncbi:MAG: radical SAM protein [Luteitalea sp.]|nr:radical SAM protein [Luteitalea sp.]
MRVAVILVWRPKHFPSWEGRGTPPHDRIPAALSVARAAAPYTGTHIASLLPRDWDIRLVHEMVRDVDLEMDVDAVFLSTMDFCAPHARRLAAAFRARGVTVIVGGLYPTLHPEYFAGDGVSVVVGEAEPVMPRLIADLRRGRLEPLYRAEGLADLSTIPPPRYDLVETEFTLPMGYEATRGCPFSCSFCVLSALRSSYRRRPIGNVLRDIQQIPANWSWRQRKIVNFMDNNLGADRAYFKELCEALIPLKRFWSTETSIDTVTPETARLMGKSGCRYLYIGLESLAQDSLTMSNKRHNRVRDYRERIRLLHDNGIVVMSIFLLGLDGDTPEYLERLPELVEEVDVDIPVYSLAVPIVGTPFHAALRDAGRLASGDLLDASDGVHVAYEPRRVSPDELELALAHCMRRTYHPLRVARRIARRAVNGHWALAMSAAANQSYMGYQRALARTTLERLAERRRAAGAADVDGPRRAESPIAVDGA